MKRINKIMAILIIVINTGYAALAEEAAINGRPGDSIDNIFIYIYPGTEGKFGGDYVTVSSRTSDVAEATIVPHAYVLKEYDKFKLKINLKKIGTTVIRVIVNREDYDVCGIGITVEVSENPKGFNKTEYKINLKKSNNSKQSTFFNLFNPFLLNEGTRVPYRE